MPEGAAAEDRPDAGFEPSEAVSCARFRPQADILRIRTAQVVTVSSSNEISPLDSSLESLPFDETPSTEAP